MIKMKRKTRLILIYFGIVIFLLSVQATFLDHWYEKTTDDIGRKALTISQAVAGAIDVEQYEKIVQNKERNAYFYQMQDYFHKVQQQTGVKYLYVKHKISDSQVEYIYDAEKDSLGEVDELFTPEAYTSKNGLHTGVKSYDKWGTFITGYSPLINNNGKIIGIVGTDIDVKYFYDELWNRLKSILIYTVEVALCFALLVFITVKRKELFVQSPHKAS